MASDPHETALNTAPEQPEPSAEQPSIPQSTSTANTATSTAQQSNSMPTNGSGLGPVRTPADLPPEALALASRLFEAARQGNRELLQAALQGGLGANMRNEKGDTLLMLASYHGHLETVRLLLQHGADPNTLNDRGQSPLAGTVFKNERNLGALLVQSGADPDAGQPSARDTMIMFRMEAAWEGILMGRTHSEAES